MAGRLLSQEPQKYLDGDEWQIEVRDGDGLIFFTFAFVATDAPVAMIVTSDGKAAQPA